MQSAPESVSPAAVPGWATNIPGRRPEFKAHNTLGQAKNAVINMSRYSARNGFAEDMVIYKLSDNGRYEPWLKISQGSFRNDYEQLAEKPQSKGDRLGEINRLERSLRYHEVEADRIRKEIEARRRELNLVGVVS